MSTILPSPQGLAKGPSTAAPSPASDRQPWRRTWALIRSDMGRTVAMMGGDASLLKRAFWCLLPGAQALIWYRLARHAHLAGWRNLAWFIYLFNTYLTRIEISPKTHIGEACFIGHAPVVLCGRFGDRFTIHGDGGTGGGMAEEDIGGGPDLPVIGDDVTFAIRAMVLGPVRIGDGARLGPTCTVTRDVAPGALVIAAPARVVARPSDDAPVQPTSTQP